jgi:hypothetical protein
MAGDEAVLVKVLDAKNPLDLGTAFTGEVKKATQVRDAFFFHLSHLTELLIDPLSTHSRGSRYYTMRWVELHRSRSKSIFSYESRNLSSSSKRWDLPFQNTQKYS